MRKTALGVLAFGMAMAIGGVPAGAQQFVTPLVSDFEDERYEAFFGNVADQLRGTLENGTLVVVSESAAGSGRLAEFTLSADGPTAVFVDVSAEFTTPDEDAEGRISGAGIIIRRSAADEPMSFYGLLLQNDGYLAIAWVGSAVVQRIGGSLPEGSGDIVRLAATESGNGVQFFIDGKPVAKVSDSRVTGRRLGLAVLGGGAVVFDNFGLNTIADIGNGDSAQQR